MRDDLCWIMRTDMHTHTHMRECVAYTLYRNVNGVRALQAVYKGGDG